MEEHGQINDHAIADNRYATWRQNATWEKVRGEFFAIDDDGVAGIVATLITHDIVHASTEQICCFALALIAPLGTENHDGWHVTEG